MGLFWPSAQSSSTSHQRRPSSSAVCLTKPLFWRQPHRAVKITPALGGRKIMLVMCEPAPATSRSVHARRLACAARLSALGSQTSRNHGSRLLTSPVTFAMISAQLE